MLILLPSSFQRRNWCDFCWEINGQSGRFINSTSKYFTKRSFVDRPESNIFHCGCAYQKSSVLKYDEYMILKSAFQAHFDSTWIIWLHSQYIRYILQFSLSNNLFIKRLKSWKKLRLAYLESGMCEVRLRKRQKIEWFTKIAHISFAKYINFVVIKS